MNLILTINDVNIDKIYYFDPIHNTIMNNSKFIKIIYSDENIMLNGIYILLSLNITSAEHYYNKIKLSYDNTIDNTNILKSLYNIEHNILRKYKSEKRARNILQETFSVGQIKLYPSNENINNKKLLLKISGIWENEKEYGLTYKLLYN